MRNSFPFTNAKFWFAGLSVLFLLLVSAPKAWAQG